MNLVKICAPAFAVGALFFILSSSSAQAAPLRSVANWPLKAVAETAHFEIDQITASTMSYQGSLVAFEEQLEDAYALLNTIDADPKVSTRAQDKIVIVFTDLQGIASLAFQSQVEFSGYFDPELVKRTGRDLVLIDPEGSLDESLIHRVVHEIQHLFLSTRCPNAPLWLNEGLSELLAWRVTPTLEPLVATSAFLDLSADRPLEQLSRSDLSMADYGQDYLFVRYLWEQRKESLGAQSGEKEGELLFNEITPQNGCLPTGFASPNYASVERDFIYSLLVPGAKTQSGSIGYDGDAFLKQPNSPLQGTLTPGVTFALIDATQAIRSGKQLHISAPAPLETAVVTVSENNQVSIQPLSQSIQLPEQGTKSAAVLILNLSNSTGNYLVSFQ